MVHVESKLKKGMHKNPCHGVRGTHTVSFGESRERKRWQVNCVSLGLCDNFLSKL